MARAAVMTRLVAVAAGATQPGLHRAQAVALWSAAWTCARLVYL